MSLFDFVKSQCKWCENLPDKVRTPARILCELVVLGLLGGIALSVGEAITALL